MQPWEAPSGNDLWQVVSKTIVQKADEDSAGGTNDLNNFDTSLDSRASKAVEHAVKEVRGAIEACGRYPFSATASTVPPEGVGHTLAIAAYRLCMPVPSLLAVLMGDGGQASPMARLYTDALEWVKALRNGASFTEPEDPVGQDWQTEVSASNPVISGVLWGDSLADGDEYAAGITADGVVVSRFSQNMNTQ